MHPGNHLHHPAVAMTEPDPVEVLHTPGIRVAVLGDRDVPVAGQHAGHAPGPQDLLLQPTVDEGLQIGQILERITDPRQRGCDELDQGLGVIGSDVRVGQCGTERPRVRGQRHTARQRDPQTLFLEPETAFVQQVDIGLVAEPGKSGLYGIEQRRAPGEWKGARL